VPTKTEPLLVSVERIWANAPHSALTDLIYWKGEFWCVFREADVHFGGENGILRLLKSRNGIVWQLTASLELEGWDLRDPKLSVTPDGTLMLLTGASFLSRRKERLAHQSLVSFSHDGNTWQPLTHVLTEEWLWRVTWFQGKGYGIAYYFLDPQDRGGEWGIRLYETENGIHYRVVTSFDIPGQPNEATLRFLPSGQMIALLRRNGPVDDHAWIGYSFPPYEDWLWADAGIHFAGPNFLILPDGNMWAAGRIISTTPYGFIEQTALAKMDSNSLTPKLILPSGGDTSYPGMVYQEPYLWLSYYSSHESSTGIYFAKIALK
jgi:hypothetical protein